MSAPHRRRMGGLNSAGVTPMPFGLWQAPFSFAPAAERDCRHVPGRQFSLHTEREKWMLLLRRARRCTLIRSVTNSRVRNQRFTGICDHR